MKLSMTVKEAAEEVSVSEDTIDRAIKAGRLKAKRTGKTGGKRLVSAAALEAWFDQLEDA